jgi:hypothetical protein
MLLLTIVSSSIPSSSVLSSGCADQRTTEPMRPPEQDVIQARIHGHGEREMVFRRISCRLVSVSDV